MHLIHRLILSLLLSGIGACPALATQLPTLEEFDWQLADNPWETFRWAKERFESLPVADDPAHEIRVINFFLATATQIQEMDLVDRHLPRIEAAWQKSLELSLLRDRVSLGFSLAMYYRTQNQLDRSDQLYKQVIDEARRFHDDQYLVQILSAYGQALDVGSAQTQALQYLHEAQALAADSSRKIHPLHRHVASLTAALQLYEYGDAPLNQVIEHSMKYFLEVRPRFVLCIFAFNIARLLLQKNEEEAIPYYEMALQEARSIDDKSTMGAVLAELAEIDNKNSRFAEAETKAAEAAQVIGMTDKHWRGRALAEQARSLWKLGRLQEAMRLSSEALALVSTGNLRRLEFIHEMRADIQEELGLLKDSIQSHKKAKEVRTQRVAEVEKDTFAKAKVELGLQMLAKENELQAERLKLSRYLVVAALGSSILAIWALVNGRRVRKAKEKIQIILDVIEEGILTIDHQLRPEPEFSRYLHELYPELFKSGLDAIDSLFPAEIVGSEIQSIIRETLRACLGEEALSWSLNVAHLPTEMLLPGPSPRSILVLWQPLFDADQKIRGFLLSLRDISAQKTLQKEVRKAETLQQRMQEILLTRASDAARLLDRLRELLHTGENSPNFKRELHTRKGEARTLGLKGLSQLIHELESGSPSASEDLQSGIESYHKLLYDVFAGRHESAETPTSLLATLAPLLPALKQQLAEGAVPFQTIEVSDSVLEWPPSILDAVRQNLLHALANSADHGYILPKKRGKPGSAAFFRVEAREISGRIEVRVRDFGAGLDLQRLEQLAHQLGFQPAPDETIADVVFLDGLSTAEQASTTSGRGVGLSAVREICQRFQGQVFLRANDQGSGSMLVMIFPLISCAA